MKRFSFESEVRHQVIGNSVAERIVIAVKARLDLQALGGGGRADEGDDSFVANEWPPSPVECDVGKKAVLNLVPFAGAGREVADLDSQPCTVRKVLKLSLPHTRDRAVASPRIGSDEEFLGCGISLATHQLPPFLDRANSESWRVVVDPDVYEALVGADVEHPIRNGLGAIVLGEVVGQNLDRRSFRLPLPSRASVFTDELLLFRVDGDDRSPVLQELVHS